MIDSAADATYLLQNGRTLLGPGWRAVDSFNDEDDLEEFEEEEEVRSCDGYNVDGCLWPGILHHDGPRYGYGFKDALERIAVSADGESDTLKSVGASAAWRLLGEDLY
jgi:hypothetical protein